MDTLVLFLVCLAAVGCVYSVPIDDENPFDDGRNYQRTSLGDSIDKASLKFLHEAYKAGEDKNVITSPLGIMILLSMYSAGAGPVSKEEISRMLGGTDLKQTSKSYSDLSSEFAKMNPDYLTLANRIYIQDGLKLKDDFQKSVRTYDSDVLNIDFKEMEEAAKIINKWSNETTKGNIPAPIEKGTLSADTILGLFNIIYFKGHWAVPFKVEDTKDEDFHVDAKTVVQKPTMNLKDTFYYTEAKELGARLLELPYKETGFRMVVVLPDEVDGLTSVLEKASDKGLLDHVFKLEPSSQDVELHMPKFEVKTKLDLKELLPKVGIQGIFSEATYDIVHGTDPVAVTKSFQEAIVKVDEEGATAAAFTALIFVGTSLVISEPPPPISFKVDRPFVYYLHTYSIKTKLSLLGHTPINSFAGPGGAFSFDGPPPPIPFKVDRSFMYYILYQDKVVFAGTYAH